MIFDIFSIKNGSNKQEDFWKAKKSHFEASKANCGRSAAVRAGPGEGTKGWGKALGAGILGFAFEAGFRGRQLRDLRINVRHARLSLREAADVLRTNRRTRREEGKAQVIAKAWVLHR